MKKLIVLLALMFSSSVSTQTVEGTKSIICGNTKAVIATLRGRELDQDPVWIALFKEKNPTRFALLVNEKSSAWTFIEYNSEMACILAFGDKSEMLTRLAPVSVHGF